MDSRLIKARLYPKKQLLLKDYLLDDFGSCSSNGFKSFPRRQCCSSVPAFLRESDPKRKRGNSKRRLMSFNKAFRSVFTAVKRLPFTAGWRSSAEKRRPRDEFGSGGWRRKMPEEWKKITRWKSFDQLLKEDSRSSEGSYRWPAAVSLFASECSIGSGSGGGDGNGSGDVNLDVTVTVMVEANDVVEDETKEVVGVRKAGVTNDGVSVQSTTTSDGSNSTNSSTNPEQKQWGSDHESKEQFSPMSVLDCPFDDEDEEVSSPFQQRLARMEGTKKKLLKKIHMLESLAKLEPLNLATCLASKPDSDNDSSNYIDEKFTFGLLNQQDRAEEKESAALLCQIKSMYSSYDNDNKSNDKILLDFFRQGLSNQPDQPSSNYEMLLKDAQDWLDRRTPYEMASNWVTETNRATHVKDLERGGEWKTLDQEIKEVASMLESEVFDALFDELLEDMIEVL